MATSTAGPAANEVDQWTLGTCLVRVYHEPSEWATPYVVVLERDGRRETLPERQGDLVSASLYAKRCVAQGA